MSSKTAEETTDVLEESPIGESEFNENATPDQMAQLVAENERLKREYAALHKKYAEGYLATKVLLATVPGLTVEMEIAKPPIFGPDNVQQISIRQHFRLNEGEVLHSYYYDRKTKSTPPIPTQFMQSESENPKHKDRGIVLWDSAKLPEDGGETKEQATIRGLKNFIEYVNLMEANLSTMHGELRLARGADALPPLGTHKSIYKTEGAMIDLRVKAVKKLKELEKAEKADKT